MLECEADLGAHARSDAATRAASSEAQYASTSVGDPRRARPASTVGYQASTSAASSAGSGAAGADRSTRSSSRCTASPISVARRPPSAPPPVVVARPDAGDALGPESERARVVLRDGAEREACETRVARARARRRDPGAAEPAAAAPRRRRRRAPAASPRPASRRLDLHRRRRGRRRRGIPAVETQQDAGVAARDLDRLVRRRARAPPPRRAASAPTRSACARSRSGRCRRSPRRSAAPSPASCRRSRGAGARPRPPARASRARRRTTASPPGCPCGDARP